MTDEIDATPSSGCVFYDLAIACRRSECDLCQLRAQADLAEAGGDRLHIGAMSHTDRNAALFDEPAQIEGWQEPLRQMEG